MDPVLLSRAPATGGVIFIFLSEIYSLDSLGWNSTKIVKDVHDKMLIFLQIFYLYTMVQNLLGNSETDFKKWKP